MATPLESYTTEEQGSIVRLLWGKGLSAKDIYKEMFLICGGKCLSRKAVHNWVEKFSQGRSKVVDDETEVRKWLRQQSTDFYAVGFAALVKLLDKCVTVGGGYVEKYNAFFPVSNIKYFTFYVHL
jgi:hypothetical protein